MVAIFYSLKLVAKNKTMEEEIIDILKKNTTMLSHHTYKLVI